jgi:hypothetical protein
MNRVSEYRKHAVQCLKLAESSNERDRRALVQMAADWHALADKASHREAIPREQQPPPDAAWPKTSDPSDPPVRPQRLQKKARIPVQTVILKSR